MREPDNDILLYTLGSAPLVLLCQIPIVYSLEHSSTKLYELPNRVERYWAKYALFDKIKVHLIYNRNI